MTSRTNIPSIRHQKLNHRLAFNGISGHLKDDSGSIILTLSTNGMPEGQALEALARQVGSPQWPDALVNHPSPMTFSTVQPEISQQAVPIKPVLNQPPNDRRSIRSRKLTASFLALFLGSMGLHKFYLGRILPGCTYLALWIIAIIIFSVLDASPDAPVNALGYVGIAIILATQIVPFAESITYFSRSIQDFERINLIGKRPWF